MALIFKEEALALGILKYEDEAENESGRSMPPHKIKNIKNSVGCGVTKWSLPVWSRLQR